MKKLILTGAVLAMTAGVAMAQDVVRMGTEGAYPPYNFINDKGEVDGFERELGDKLCEMASLNCTWVTNDWDSIIPNLLSGNYDTILAGMSITEERKQTIDFTQNYFPPAASAYVAQNEDVDLQGVIAAQVGTIQADYIAQSGATLLEFATLDDTIAAVKNGEADAVFADKDALTPFISDGSGLVIAGEDVPLGDGIGIGLRKSDTALKDKFNAGITTLKENGELNALITKWFGADAKTF
ncbi:transporter substrate-binding domain-containing protein [Paenirhodobacter populi]|uniref:Transporter substrate-binding domain-containing protein n=1 Tax=Paenirhodobacter populi TaxID=2306993 RepID=A0A443K8C9_9RHOB|nr:transporter substrate-binding domain-containing protein [Sinirhodobacter populi]RWR06421.1 transporter substrate-binding domain-containing protein [Sinirhodobacter populi]RWR18555.1 transporter substrate-binding domain-containing protein [Sinirhodobacter populi]RWR28972.1 transporter substrate-binding domain-containing protein [Sinirhodobacter populi]RWR29424.1 transporter substrate-binding domain-containing protein [Sinirhodobacter populi]